MNEQMTPRERVLAAFKRLPYDRIPVINPVSIVIRESMVKTGSFFPQAHYDAAKMALLAEAGHDFIGFDCVSPYFSVCNEASALGCSISWGSVNQLPAIRTYITYDQLNVKPDSEYIAKKPIRTIIEAIKLLKKTYGNNVAIVGKVIGPWTLSFNLFSTQKMLTNLVLNFEYVRELICLLNEYILKFIEAQLDAGADIITISDDAAGDFLSLDGYRMLILPLHQKINKLIHSAGSHSIIHLNGGILDKLSSFVDAGFDAVNMDSYNPLPAAKKIINGSMLVCGGLNVPQVLLTGAKEDVINEVVYYMNNKIDILAPDGMLLMGVPSENLKAVFNGISKFHSQIKNY